MLMGLGAGGVAGKAGTESAAMGAIPCSRSCAHSSRSQPRVICTFQHMPDLLPFAHQPCEQRVLRDVADCTRRTSSVPAGAQQSDLYIMRAAGCVHACRRGGLCPSADPRGHPLAENLSCMVNVHSYAMAKPAAQLSAVIARRVAADPSTRIAAVEASAATADGW